MILTFAAPYSPCAWRRERHITVITYCATKVSINALSALIYGDRAGVMVRQGAACYIVGDQIKNISFSAGYEKNYRINCESSGEKLSDAEMRYLPDMSYYSMHCAVNNKNAAYF